MEDDQDQYENIYLIETVDGMKIVGEGATSSIISKLQSDQCPRFIQLKSVARFSHDESGDAVLMMDPLTADTINIRSDHIFCISHASSYLGDLYTKVRLRVIYKNAIAFENDDQFPMINFSIH